MAIKIIYVLTMLCAFAYGTNAQIVERFGSFATEWDSDVTTYLTNKNGKLVVGGTYGTWGYLSEVDPSTGTTTWEQHIESDYSASCVAVVEDEKGQLFALIQFRRAVKFKSIQVDFKEFRDAVMLLKVNPTGVYSDKDYVVMENVFAQNMVYHQNSGLTASLLFRNRLKFIDGKQYEGSLDDILVANFNHQIGLKWTTHLPGNGDNTVSAIATDANGDIILAGQGVGSIDFTGEKIEYVTTLHSKAFMYLTKLSRSGQVQWARILNKDGSVTINALAINNLGTIFVGGTFTTSFDYGGAKSSATGKGDVFLLALNANASKAESWLFGKSGNFASITGLYVTGNRVVAVGNFFRGVDFGSVKLVTDEPEDAWRLNQNSFILQWNSKRNKVYADHYSSEQAIGIHGVTGRNFQVYAIGSLKGSLYIGDKKRYTPVKQTNSGFFHQRGFFELEDNQDAKDKTEVEDKANPAQQIPVGVFDDFLLSRLDKDTNLLIAMDKNGERLAIQFNQGYRNIQSMLYDKGGKNTITLFEANRPVAMLDAEQIVLFKDYTATSVRLELYDNFGKFILEDVVDLSSLKQPYSYKLQGRGPNNQLEIQTNSSSDAIDVMYYAFYVLDAAEVLMNAKHKAVSKVINPAGSLLFGAMLAQMEKGNWRYETVEKTSKLFDWITTSESIASGTFSKLDAFRKLIEWSKDAKDQNTMRVKEAQRRIDNCKKQTETTVSKAYDIQGDRELYIPCFSETAQVTWNISHEQASSQSQIKATTASNKIKLFEKYDGQTLILTIADLDGKWYNATIVIEMQLPNGKNIQEEVVLSSRPCNYYYVPYCKNLFDEGLINQKELEECENDVYDCIKNPKYKRDVFLQENDPTLAYSLSELLVGTSDVVEGAYRLNLEKMNLARKIFDKDGNPYKGEDAGELRDHVRPAPCVRKWLSFDNKYVIPNLWDFEFDSVNVFALNGYRWNTQLQCFVLDRNTDTAYVLPTDIHQRRELKEFFKKELYIVKDDTMIIRPADLHLVYDWGYEIEVMNSLVPLSIIYDPKEEKSARLYSYPKKEYTDSGGRWIFEKLREQFNINGASGEFPVLVYFQERHFSGKAEDSLYAIFEKKRKNNTSKFEFRFLLEDELSEIKKIDRGDSVEINSRNKIQELLNDGWLPYQSLITLRDTPILWYRDRSVSKKYEIAKVVESPRFIREFQGSEFDPNGNRIVYFQEYLKWSNHYLNTIINQEMKRNSEFILFTWRIVPVHAGEITKKERNINNQELSKLSVANRGIKPCVFDTYDGESCIRFHKDEGFVEFMFIREKK